jgi:hypothetical protein
MGKKLKKLVFLLVLLFWGLLPLITKAQFGIEIITAPAVWLAKFLAKVAIAIPISWFILLLSNYFLAWVTNPNFVTVSYTHNPVVTAGWTIVRDFCNMFFILILVVIGISVALRIREYEIKKTIPRLIAVVLLINFTPVIAGVIIDASNIIMNFFFSAATGGFGGIINIAGQSKDAMARVFTDALTHPKDFFDGTLFFRAFIIITFNFIGAFLLFLFGILFLFRYIALWILVILSPLAFLGYILPATSRIWKTWWNQFISWCFIGIGGAFFIYLAQLLSSEINNMVTRPGLASGLGDATQILFLAIPVAFLAAGYFAVVSTSAMGANQLIGLVRRGGKWTRTKEGRKAISKLKEGVRKRVSELAPKRAKERVARLEAFKFRWGEKAGVEEEGRLRKAGRWMQRRAAELASVPVQVIGKAGKPLIGGGIPTEKRAAEEAYEEAKKRDVLENLAALRQTTSRTIKAGILRAMGEKKQLKPALDERAVGKHQVLTTKEIIDAYKKAWELQDKDAIKEIEVALSDKEEMLKELAKAIDQATRNLPEEKRTEQGVTKKEREEKGYTSLEEKVLASIRTREDMEKIGEVSDKMIDVAANFWDGHQVSQAAQVFGREFVEKLQRKAEELGANFFYGINPTTGRVRNPNIPRFLASTTAQRFGFYPIKNIENPEAAKERMRASQEVEREIRERWNDRARLDQLALEFATKRARAEDEAQRQALSSGIEAIRARIEQLEMGGRREESRERETEKKEEIHWWGKGKGEYRKKK